MAAVVRSAANAKAAKYQRDKRNQELADMNALAENQLEMAESSRLARLSVSIGDHSVLASITGLRKHGDGGPSRQEHSGETAATTTQVKVQEQLSDQPLACTASGMYKYQAATRAFYHDPKCVYGVAIVIILNFLTVRIKRQDPPLPP